MNEDAFEQMAMTYGADLSRWPGGASASNWAFAASEPGRAILLRAATLDAWVAEARPVVSSARSQASVQAVMSRLTERPRLGLRLRDWFAPAGWMSAASLCGMAVGLWLSGAFVTQTRADLLVAVLLGAEGMVTP